VGIDIFQATILGAVQGITEFLPVSSRAHLILVSWIFGWPDPGIAFEVALHLGTLAALLLYFWKDWVHLGRSATRLLAGDRHDPDARLALYVILATIPAGIVGLLFEKQLDEFSTPTVIAASLIGVALFMRMAEVIGKRKTDLGTMSMSDAVMIGFAQALAVIPGVSRSGITITAGLFRDMTRKSAAVFSFLMSAPIVGGAVVKKTFDIMRDGLPADQVPPFVVGILVSTFVGFVCIAGLMRYLQTRNTFVFINYRIALGFLVLGLGYFGGMR